MHRLLEDGKRQLRLSGMTSQTTVETRKLLDVDARLRDMDRMGYFDPVMNDHVWSRCVRSGTRL